MLKQNTVYIFFHVKKAFDKLHPSAIFKTLQNIGFRENIHFTRNFLSKRAFQMRMRGEG